MSIRIDALSATWINLRSHIEARQDVLRNRLENTGVNWDETQQTRARLAELNSLLALTENESPALVDEDFELPG